MVNAYLGWIQKHRSEALHREAKRHLGRFAEVNGNIPAGAIEGRHLEAFQDELFARDFDAVYVRKHAVTLRACFNRGAKLGIVPKGFKPFMDIEGVKVQPKPLLESDLPTAEEVQRFFAGAKPWFGEMLRVYFHTGARTHELMEARAGDFQPNARQIVLAKHKRSKTLREYKPRCIQLNDEALAIVKARCQGLQPDDLLWPNRAGKPFTNVLLGDMFARVRVKAKVRDSLTIYSFRHLWISEMLMAGHDSLLVARMAGTSVKMIETVYGHFRTSSYAEAQAKLDAVRRG